MAALREISLLEQAMRARDLNSRQLACASRIPVRVVDLLRLGECRRLTSDIGERIERALGVPAGHLFQPGSVSGRIASRSF